MGRERETALLLDLLAGAGSAPPAVVLRGAPGAGKSHLAAAVAARRSRQTGTRHVHVDVVSVAQARAAVLAAPGLPPSACGAAGSTAGPRPLLVLDGLDRLPREERSGLLAEAAAADHAVLATARRPLALPDVPELPLSGLAVPQDCTALDLDASLRVPSVALYVAAISALNPAFAMGHDNHYAIAWTCAALHGMPGALVRAARVAALEGPEAVRGALGQPPGGRLTGLLRQYAAPGTPAPESTPGCADRTDAPESTGRTTGADAPATASRLLSFCALFADGFGPEALREVTRWPGPRLTEEIERLLGQGLLTTSTRPSGSLDGFGHARLHLPPATVPGASGALPDSAWLRHARYYARFARAATRQLVLGDQHVGLTALRAEEANLRTALGELLSRELTEEALALATDLTVYWDAVGAPADWPDHLRLLSRPEAVPPALRGRAALLQADAAIRTGHPEAGPAFLAEAGPAHRPDALPDGTTAAYLRAQAFAALPLRPSDAPVLLRRAALTHRSLGEGHLAGRVELEAALGELLHSDTAAAIATARTALSDAQRRHDPLIAGAALLHLSAFCAAAGQRTAAEYHRRAVATLRPLGWAAVLGAHLALVRSPLLPDTADRAVDTARIIGSLHSARALAGDGDPAPDFTLARSEEPTRRLLGERRHLAALREGARTPTADLIASFGVRLASPGPVPDRPVPHPVPPAGPAPGPPGRTGAADGRLTPRQTQVSQLVAAGLSNKQIARQLQISEWTVVNHIRETMRRLDCTSRVAIAGWILRNTAGPPAVPPAQRSTAPVAPPGPALTVPAPSPAADETGASLLPVHRPALEDHRVAHLPAASVGRTA
ncbi:LuxR family transcriptional regulator [Streptomyces sp. NPDC005876]|uniref:LuxR family transcriptional regulator n=1 Tax=Streptomyces sp. NPDC005876 TaxID=3157076 RepID=UPI0033DA3A93